MVTVLVAIGEMLLVVTNKLKNVIAVANLNGLGVLANSSSRGPAADGRIKPDIGAKGTVL